MSAKSIEVLRPGLTAGLLGLAFSGLLAGCASPRMASADVSDTVGVGSKSEIRRLVPAQQLERTAAQQFEALKEEARKKGALLPPSHPTSEKLVAMANRLKPHALAWNGDAARWRWEVVVLKSNQLNAFCMPGGKIAFYTGLIEKLKLDDDEIAAVMGHEMAHALREHTRDRIAKSQLTDMGASIVSELLGFGQLGRQALGYGTQLLGLKFSRDDEKEADLVGLDISARAGYDPRAALSLWRKMKEANKGAPPEWLSTHPSGSTRMEEISMVLPRVLPLYAQAIGKAVEDLPDRDL
ncbi:MAG: M48 family metallopeptidase [Burkholderiaceae bacterium]